MDKDSGQDEEKREEAGVDLERLAQKHQHALYGDYFQILDLPRSADTLAVARAIAAATAEFDLARLGDLPESERSKLRLVAAVVKDAALVLGDPSLRARYRAQLFGAR